MNQYESQAMREILLKSGFRECITKDIADIYILNTCTVTGKADKESRRWLGLFHKANPNARIVVTGCYVEEGADDINDLPGISHIMKNSEKARIAEILGETGTADKAARRPANGAPALAISDFKNHAKAFVKIQDGCENFCSYCKVPFVRGRMISRPIADIVEEVKALVNNGFQEIVLTGICLGAWGTDFASAALASEMGIDSMNLVDILRELDKMPDSFRVRLSSIEPRYVSDDLVDYISKHKRICRHLHIPLQSGDDTVLAAMNRPYTSGDYKALINKIRERVEGISLTTDVLVGFPGESDANFKNTEDFIKEMLPSRVHLFSFSKRKGTRAYDMAGALKDETIKKRYNMLKAASLSASYLYRRRSIGQTLSVLAETRRDKGTKLLTGYSDNYIKVYFDGPDELMKRITPVRITEANLLYTFGEYESR